MGGERVGDLLGLLDLTKSTVHVVANPFGLVLGAATCGVYHLVAFVVGWNFGGDSFDFDEGICFDVGAPDVEEGDLLRVLSTQDNSLALETGILIL